MQNTKDEDREGIGNVDRMDGEHTSNENNKTSASCGPVMIRQIVSIYLKVSQSKYQFITV